jgi:hypothetical protein
MKQHPDGQPRGAITVQRRDDNDRQADQEFEGDWIDGVTPDVKPTTSLRQQAAE